MKKKIAIIGASHFQSPLILKAKEMGLETHTFAWACGDIGETQSDFFYPISIVEKEQIAEKCQEIGIDGICSIASDLANITVSYVANELGLTANSVETVAATTNKSIMRSILLENQDPSPKSITFSTKDSLDKLDSLTYPIIVKPSDRSGSRGITKLSDPNGLEDAIKQARNESFNGNVMVEEFAGGEEFSVEFISWQGNHYPLAITKKYTSGSPRFIETGHIIPASLDQSTRSRLFKTVASALTHLGVVNGASHSELKIDFNDEETISIIEIGSRMGGDCIGSDLVVQATGYDFLENVIKVALGEQPELPNLMEDGSAQPASHAACIRFIFDDQDLIALEQLRQDKELELVFESPIMPMNQTIVDSSTRYGYYIFKSDSADVLLPYLPH